jgi:ABC-type cobalamin transport system ATPase subunit
MSQLITADLLLEAQQPFLFVSLHQLVDHGGGKSHTVAKLAGCLAESQRSMGLAGSRVAQQQNILAAQQEYLARQFQNHGLVQV